MKRGYRYRLYPTAEQALLMARSCGVARLVYNASLEQRSLAYRLTGRLVGWAAQDAEWVALKKDPQFAFLREVHSDVLGQSLRDLDTAFGRFFAGLAGYPRRHRKGERDSFRLCQRRIRDKRSGHVHVSIEVRRLNRKWGEIKLPGLEWVRFALVALARGRDSPCHGDAHRAGLGDIAVRRGRPRARTSPGGRSGRGRGRGRRGVVRVLGRGVASCSPARPRGAGAAAWSGAAAGPPAQGLKTPGAHQTATRARQGLGRRAGARISCTG